MVITSDIPLPAKALALLEKCGRATKISTVLTIIACLIILAALPAVAAAAPPGVRFEGGSGDSPEQAVIIRGAANSIVGINAEYQILQERFGRQHLDWRLVKQELIKRNKRILDALTIEIIDKGKKVIYFDITDFCGKL